MNKNILFLESFADMLSQGYTVEEALYLNNQIFHLPFYQEYIDALTYGEDIYDLLIDGDYPDVFKRYLIFYKNKSVLSDAILKSLSMYHTQVNFLNRLKNQLTYPALLVIFLFFFSLFVLFFLMPQIDMLFTSFDIKTSILSSFIFLLFRMFPIISLFCFVCVFINVLLLLFGIKKKIYKIIDLYMCIPIINQMLYKYFSLKFALVYNELTLENIDTSTIVELLNGQVHDDIKIVLYEVKKLLNKGEHIENALKQCKYLDPLLISFFTLHIYNYNNKDMMAYYIDITYKTLELYISRFVKTVIPVVYCFVSFFIVGVYVAIILPLMNGFSGI